MKVKELIEELQKFDPEAYFDSPILFLLELPGYYDGYHTTYEDKKLKFSIKATKVRPYFVDFDWLIESCNGDEEEFRSRVEMIGLADFQKERLEKEMKKAIDDWKEVCDIIAKGDSKGDVDV